MLCAAKHFFLSSEFVVVFASAKMSDLFVDQTTKTEFENLFSNLYSFGLYMELIGFVEVQQIKRSCVDILGSIERSRMMSIRTEIEFTA